MLYINEILACTGIILNYINNSKFVFRENRNRTRTDIIYLKENNYVSDHVVLLRFITDTELHHSMSYIDAVSAKSRARPKHFLYIPRSNCN